MGRILIARKVMAANKLTIEGDKRRAAWRRLLRATRRREGEGRIPYSLPRRSTIRGQAQSCDRSWVISVSLSCIGRIEPVGVIRGSKHRQAATLWRSDLPAFTETITSQFLVPSESTARDSDRSRPPRYDPLGECFRPSGWCCRYANALPSRPAP